ncbi:MAG: helix-turn-helix domain-containing protein, partial [Treponema sp.]|nr:helix-turn-helix domain-containing protein [Treponema sp.]
MYRSKDLREQAGRYRKAGHSAVETAEAFGTSDDTIYRWEKQFDDTGDLSTKKRSVRHS